MWRFTLIVFLWRSPFESSPEHHIAFSILPHLLMVVGAITSTSAVPWNGINHTTTYVSPSSLTASITASDVAVSGTANVTVVNPTPGGGTSAAVNLDIACAIQISVDSLSRQLATINKDVYGANLPSSMDFTSGNSNLGATVSTFQAAHLGLVQYLWYAGADSTSRG